MIDTELIISKIKSLQEERKATTKELASYLGVSQQTIYDYYKGKSQIPLRNLLKIADFFKVSPAYFFGEPVGLSQSGTGNVVVNGDIKAREVKQILSHSHELEKENERLKAELRGCQELLKSKDEIIKLLKEQNKNR